MSRLLVMHVMLAVLVMSVPILLLLVCVARFGPYICVLSALIDPFFRNVHPHYWYGTSCVHHSCVCEQTG